MIVRHTPRRRPRVEIVPLIDVIFFLVLFFVVTTTFRQDPLGLELELPKAVTGSPQQVSEIIISVDRNGQLYLDGSRADADRIRAAVRDAVSRRPDTFVIIRGDEDVAYRHVVRAMDIVREVGGYRLGLAVELGQN